MRIKILILSVAVLIFTGCAGISDMFCEACGKGGMHVDRGTKGLFHDVMVVKTDCTDHTNWGKKVIINGANYRSDTALKHCLEKNMIDTNIGLKKVYFHRFTDERENAKSIFYTKRDGSRLIFNSNPRLEVLFYMFLEDELNNRGIVVVDTQTSPYTYRLDFKFYKLHGEYDRKSEFLGGNLQAEMFLSNINFKKQKRLNTNHAVEKLEASKSSDFDFFVALLVKQAAMLVADEISKL